MNKHKFFTGAVLMNNKMLNNTLITSILLLLTAGSAFGQIREYRIHDRGMLHETVFNTGEIGRGWMTGQAGNVTSVPLME